MAIVAYLPRLLMGLAVTVQVFLLAALLTATASVVFGLLRISPSAPLRALARLYMSVFRGTSALVQLFWVFFALPLVGIRVESLTAAVLVLGLNAGAYGAEVIRAGLGAIPSTQWEAARALGFTRRDTLLRIALPQALVNNLPVLANLAVELMKSTSLVSLIGLADLTFEARILRDQTLASLPVFGLVLVLYFMVTSLLSAGARRLELRFGAYRGARA